MGGFKKIGKKIIQYKTMKHLLIFILCLLLFSCKGEVQSSKTNENKEELEVTKEGAAETKPSEFVVQSTDVQTANNLKNFLKLDYLKDDLEFLQPLDRKFQFYKVDLNADGKDEIFVRFLGPYFCGSGGCTFLLLDSFGEIITRFTVTRAPFFIEPSKENDWSILLVKDAGVFKELVFKDGTYPSNPSVLPKAPYDAPSGHAEIMFEDELYKSQTFEF